MQLTWHFLPILLPFSYGHHTSGPVHWWTTVWCSAIDLVNPTWRCACRRDFFMLHRYSSGSFGILWTTDILVLDNTRQCGKCCQCRYVTGIWNNLDKNFPSTCAAGQWCCRSTVDKGSTGWRRNGGMFLYTVADLGGSEPPPPPPRLPPQLWNLIAIADCYINYFLQYAHACKHKKSRSAWYMDKILLLCTCHVLSVQYCLSRSVVVTMHGQLS